VIQIPIPTLSERIDDIPLLADHVLRRFGRRMMRPDLKLTANALNELKNYGWPGNVRELENVLERAVVLAAGDTIDASDLALDPRARTAAIDAPAAAAPAAGFDVEYRKARDNFERQYLLFLIDRAGGNMTHAADLAGISRRNLYEKLERVGLAEEVVRKR
jgi:DNA-binding NtrC family response regulator